MFKTAAVLAALLAMTNFIACSSDDDDNSGKDTTVAVTGVTLDNTTASVEVDKTVTLTATVAPDNATDKTVTWATSDSTKATVADGVVTGVAAGEVTITATAGDKSASCTVTVTASSSGGESSGSETATTKTATLAYDGSAETNVPAVTGSDGVFSDVQTALADAGVVEGYSLDSTPAWKSMTFTGDDGTKNGTTAAGILITSNLTDGNTKIDFTADTTIAYATYTFTLASAADVVASVGAFNTQSSNLAGKLEILDSSSTVKTTKTGSGSKTDNGVTADSVSLDAGTYTLKFSWVLTKATDLKKVTCGIKSFFLAATTK